MEHLIVTDSTGAELRDLLFETYDFEVGDEENSFQIVINRQEYEYIPEGARLFIPDTEYGGIFRRLETDTEKDIICPGGMTWRGMMQKRIIRPEQGADYAYDTGELNSIIKTKVEAMFPGLFIGSTESTGVSVTNFQYDRYCTLYDGLRKLLKSVDYRLDIVYSQPDKAVLVTAKPIVDYSEDIELSSDMRTNYVMQKQGDGVNHLICLGSGELANRTVIDLYLDANGNISTTQYYTGTDEITEIYDYAGAEDADLMQSGIERFKELINLNRFEMSIEPGTLTKDIPYGTIVGDAIVGVDVVAYGGVTKEEIKIEIGDIVGGRDYLSGMTMTSPIVGKIITWKDGFQEIEYKLEDDITVS